MTNFNPTKAADSHAGLHGDFVVYWIDNRSLSVRDDPTGWYYMPHDADPIGPFETSQAAFLAYVAAFDAEIRAGLALS